MAPDVLYVRHLAPRRSARVRRPRARWSPDPGEAVREAGGVGRREDDATAVSAGRHGAHRGRGRSPRTVQPRGLGSARGPRADQPRARRPRRRHAPRAHDSGAQSTGDDASAPGERDRRGRRAVGEGREPGTAPHPRRSRARLPLRRRGPRRLARRPPRGPASPRETPPTSSRWTTLRAGDDREVVEVDPPPGGRRSRSSLRGRPTLGR